MFRLIRSLDIIYNLSTNPEMKIIIEKDNRIKDVFDDNEYNYISTLLASYWYLKKDFEGSIIKEKESFYVTNKNNVIIPKDISNIIINNKDYTDEELVLILGKKYIDINFIKTLNGDVTLLDIKDEYEL